VVSDAPLHHSPPELPTLFYDVLLLPTLPHSWPHHRSLFAVVKRKKGCALKKVEHNDVLKYEENYRDMLCAVCRRNSIPSARVPGNNLVFLMSKLLSFSRFCGRSMDREDSMPLSSRNAP
jgi:hypothetical protein